MEKTPTNNIVPHNINENDTAIVSLVGAGPGDPELLTIKALNVINHADVILYDHLVSPEIVALFPTHANTIAVGKRFNCCSTPQKTINQLMIDFALKGQSVCRLKGGDPFIFGRGGEEALYLEQHHIRYQVIPGITAAMGCCAYSGIPITHRNVSRGFTVITAHGNDYDIDWPTLAQLQHTIIFYMGLHKVAWIAQQLIAAGVSSQTPMAIISQGTTPQHTHLISTLIELPQQLALNPLASPALIVVGDVVRFANQIHSIPDSVNNVLAL
ncbi:uroporphyrinogen-III C-methyltransferase [Photobacterium kishitanii]|uniref:uroporphyrinogen-III C-methyltransferase n=1 Tax=Photobacterium kishitanii TaxID=318456 RepID=A0AAX0YRI9_9GAMM|nr:uroporphyrinogen-III C-methyltransferase [Photobacterium kishitanii]PSU16015.1 uroporphyrinogen-III C-methyltransferase [Photobacterium kishitanii]PSV02189.1 uroporphyrinogen-III C-methyltransferase [Photobacterium kishitanii]PSV71817.1 uroporphyrinogen-III C-methyltransferase [Photobacterium kishitanii]PSW46728.1 uroporphyrinogen-III C-methyltransferase [Photobacterium kishitanii]PSX16817.1 uroporphyrinogen-III C-methyltransferase [Photobacterium kishitanii]